MVQAPFKKWAGAVITVLLLSTSVTARVSIALMPLTTVGVDSSQQWIAASVTDLLFRSLSLLDGVSVWDPILLNTSQPLPATALTRSQSDSLLLLHHERWGWDLAIDGECAVRRDSVRFKIRVRSVRADSINSSFFDIKGTIGDIGMITAGLYSLMSRDTELRLPSGAALNVVLGTTDIRTYGTYAAGYGYQLNGNMAAALSAYTHAVALDPLFAEAQFMLGQIYDAMGDAAAARSCFDRALPAHSVNSRIAAGVAAFVLAHDSPGSAQKFIDARRVVLMRTPAGMEAIGRSYIISGEYQRAIAILTKARALGAADLSVDFTLGNAYDAAGERNQAVVLYERLLQIRPDYVPFVAALSTAYRNSGQLMESMKVLETALARQPDEIVYIVGLAQTYFNMQWYGKAEQLLKRGRLLRPDLSAIPVNLGVLAWFRGDHAGAARLLDTVARIEQNNQTVLNNQATMFFMGGDIARAVDLYKKADKSGAKNETVLYNLGLAYTRLHRYTEAAACFEELLRLAPNNPSVLMRQAELFRQRKDPEQAKSYLRRLLEISPADVVALETLVQVLREGEKYQEAIELIETYLANFPGNRLFRILQADLYRSMGWYEVALMKYQALTADLPSDPVGYCGVGAVQFDMLYKKKTSDYDNTIYRLKIALEKDPLNPEPEYMMGKIYADFKNYPTLALESYKAALAKAVPQKRAGLVAELRELIGALER